MYIHETKLYPNEKKISAIKNLKNNNKTGVEGGLVTNIHKKMLRVSIDLYSYPHTHIKHVRLYIFHFIF